MRTVTIKERNEQNEEEHFVAPGGSYADSACGLRNADNLLNNQ
jgi:hypothetical protein